jgi:hypothetical protein
MTLTRTPTKKAAQMHETIANTTMNDILLDISAERWFGDGPPRWTHGPSAKPATNVKSAELENRKLVKLLRRHSKGDASALRLADKLACCAPNHRCLSGACKICGRAAQRLFVFVAERLFARYEREILVLSVISRGVHFRVNELAETENMFARLAGKLHQALRAAGINTAVGGFDVSANEHEEHALDPHYRPHAWIFVPAKSYMRCEKAFKEFFPRNLAIKIPVHKKLFDGDMRGIAYGLKTDFARRITLSRKEMPDGTRIRQNTRDRHLRARQKMELALQLDKIGLDARLFLHGMRLEIGLNHPRIVRRRSTVLASSKRVPRLHNKPSSLVRRQRNGAARKSI